MVSTDDTKHSSFRLGHSASDSHFQVVKSFKAAPVVEIAAFSRASACERYSICTNITSVLIEMDSLFHLYDPLLSLTWTFFASIPS